MNEYIKFLALFMGAAWLVGCGMLTPVNTNQIGQVPLQVNTSCRVSLRVSLITRHQNLYIPVASALAPYDSTAMIYQDRSGEMKAYTYHQWVAPPCRTIAPGNRRCDSLYWIVPQCLGRAGSQW
jgi:ABC-type uncharacterized transport system auxiliary subunit